MITRLLTQHPPHRFLSCLLLTVGATSLMSRDAYAARRFVSVVKERSEVAHEIAGGEKADGKSVVDEDRLELYQSLSVEVAPELHLRSTFRARANLPRNDSEKESYEVEARMLTVEKSFSHAKFSLGMQEVGWGETFGFMVADVVNPRDFREPLYLDASRARVPLFMLNSQLLFDDFDIQAIYVPLPRTVPSTADFEWVANSEGGGRLGLRLGDIDLQLLHYYHWNRVPVPIAEGTPLAPQPSFHHSRVTTSGFSFSAASTSWVLRGDFVVHRLVPVPPPIPFGPVNVHSQMQGVLGYDWTAESGYTLSLQAMADSWVSQPEHLQRSNYQWLGARARDSYFSNQLELAFFAIAGIDTADLWIKPEVTYNMSPSWRIALEGHLIDGNETSGYPQFFQHQKNVVARTTYSF